MSSITDSMRNTWARLWGFSKQELEVRARVEAGVPVGQDPPDSWFLNGMANSPGSLVTPANALQIVAVYACVRVVAESLASLPLKVYRRVGPGKEPATDHALYSVLHSVANPEMTSMELREALTGHVLLRGNCYAEIELNKRGDVLALWPLNPAKTQPVRDPNGGGLMYQVTLPSGEIVMLPQYRVMHIRGLSPNGIVGYSPIGLARNAIGLAMATEAFGGQFFGNGARPGGVLQHPGKLGEVAYQRLKKSWEDRHQGLTNANRVAILEEGIQWKDVGVPPEDAQFLETRRFQTTEIARLFRVPPHMIQDLDKATFSNIEHQGIDFVVHTLRPWLVRWEQRIAMDLVGPIERNVIFAEHMIDGLLRGDIQSRYQAYSIGRQWGWLSRNDVRGMENMNPVPDGDDYLTPLNMTVLGEEPAPAAAPVTPQPAVEEQGDDQDERTIDLWVTDVVQRIASRCQDDRDPEKHGRWVSDVMQPVVRAIVTDAERSAAAVKELTDYWFASSNVNAGALAAVMKGYAE